MLDCILEESAFSISQFNGIYIPKRVKGKISIYGMNDSILDQFGSQKTSDSVPVKLNKPNAVLIGCQPECILYLSVRQDSVTRVGVGVKRGSEYLKLDSCKQLRWIAPLLDKNGPQ